MKLNFMTAGALCLTLAMASCSNSDEPKDSMSLSEKDAAFEQIAKQYLDNTVIVTYKNMADNAAALVEDLEALRDAKTDANVSKACDSFLAARKWWEKSEAFLYGPATDYGIDPHIDSWPLDRDGLVNEMKNADHIASMDAEDGDVWAGSHLGPELLGFHGIEYIIFANGAPKAAADIPQNELIYAISVAGDLRNKCWQLLLSWAGEDNVSDDILDKVDGELEWPFTTNGISYKENMLLAGQPGSTYRSWTDAMQAIIDGCATIADEVGTQKIGKPHSGEDPNYIESPYSHMSITDFYDNMVSIENSYMGGIEGQRNEKLSLHNYIAGVNSDLDAKCVAAIENAEKAISQMAAPFVLNYSDPSAQTAADACIELQNVLLEVKAELAK
jgi:hypothetical protein